VSHRQLADAGPQPPTDHFVGDPSTGSDLHGGACCILVVRTLSLDP